MIKNCKECNTIIKYGRRDKIFCTVYCKTKYHKNLCKKTNLVAFQIDEILHRNRSILYEIMGDKRIKLKVNRIMLERKKFRYKYHTHTQVNSQGKTYHYIYDYAWMSFSNDEILIIKKR